MGWPKASKIAALAFSTIEKLLFLFLYVPRALSHSQPRKERVRTPEKLLGRVCVHFGLRLPHSYALRSYELSESFCPSDRIPLS